MASAVHHNCHRLLSLLLRPPPAPARYPRLSCPPRPARLCSFFPAPSCRPVTLAEPDLVPPEPEEVEEDDDARFVVVTFYKFVPLEDPRAEVASHLHFLQGRDIHGRIYLNEQGINAQYSGPRKDAVSYADWVKKDHRFCDMLVQTSPALTGHAFPRLKLRYKPSLVQLEGGSRHLPLLDPSMRATPLSPSKWKERLEARACLDVSSSSETSGDTSGTRLLLLDVRNGEVHLRCTYQYDTSLNGKSVSVFQSCSADSVKRLAIGQVLSSAHHHSFLYFYLIAEFDFELLCYLGSDYEWDVGHFEGARRPNVDCFRSTSFGLSGETSDPLNGVDKEKTDILMYCTGGIRCDVYSTILREKGFRNLYTLEGGVSNYLKAEGPAGWVGNLFVFDGRLSLPPATFKEAAAAAGGVEEKAAARRWVGRCYACGSEVVELRHRNCANIDCNRLYLCCRWCAEELGGCCCSDCKAAPRLRPLLPGHQRYLKWHVYRDAHAMGY